MRQPSNVQDDLEEYYESLLEVVNRSSRINTQLFPVSFSTVDDQEPHLTKTVFAVILYTISNVPVCPYSFIDVCLRSNLYESSVLK